MLCALAILVSSCDSKNSEESIKSVLISEEGILVKESYFNGASSDDLHNVQSIAKSMITILIGAAIEDGYIRDVSVPIIEFMPEEFQGVDESKHSITIAHLINHTSGLEWEGYKEHEAWIQSENPIAYLLQKNIVEKPGSLYNYNSAGTHLLSVILTRSTGRSTFDYAQDKLFKPLGISDFKWDKRNDGYYDGAGFGLSMRSDDLTRVGELILNKGIVQDSQIISKSWVEHMLHSPDKKKTKWGIGNSVHGYGWYSAKIDGTEIHYSMGYGGQFIFLLPAEEKVIVVNHNHDTADGLSQQIDFIRGTLPSLISN